LEPGAHFSEVCETLVVSAHGCALRSPVKLKTGIPLHLHSKNGRETTAQVVSCQPSAADGRGWELGAKLDQPENFWELTTCPKDWTPVPVVPLPQTFPQTLPATTRATNQVPADLSSFSDVLPDSIGQQLTEEVVKQIITEALRPLQAEIMVLKEKLTRSEANRSRFEVSLSSIPPELEEQLELRLKKDLGARILDEVRQQSTNLLAAAKTSIDQMTTEGYRDFLQRVGQELQVVEQRAEDISVHMSKKLQEHLLSGMGEFQQNLVEAGDHLKRLSEELLESSKNSLQEEHELRRAELEHVREAVASESFRLHDQVESLDTQVRTLTQSIYRLESGFDKRLKEIGSEIVQTTRHELQRVADTSLNQMRTRTAEVLDDQLNEARESMTTVQETIVGSLSESLSYQSKEVLQDFEHSMEEIANLAVERWRLTLADGLNSLVKSLGEQFQLKSHSAADPR
jgi:hypothetical protein